MDMCPPPPPAVACEFIRRHFPLCSSWSASHFLPKPGYVAYISRLSDDLPFCLSPLYGIYGVILNIRVFPACRWGSRPISSKHKFSNGETSRASPSGRGSADVSTTTLRAPVHHTDQIYTGRLRDWEEFNVGSVER
ncbi:hypothetical protein CIHG_05257 [Coccidioides immitis H538.4]|uniref:Uncharacterized protein n=1 Tax=Coccidioides immitis H538.4 TaxID=396776 RepID=A0A0J8RS92_COCIT|nr:hypothetical protein CIHG_05257 [Coccidioides immitis H538.4]